GFSYQTNSVVNMQTYYIINFSPLELVKEYNYYVSSNASGLVQSNDISTTNPAILFLGDSFMEGQGARPWFYWLESVWPTDSPYQLINGGILATGVQAWERLYRELSLKHKIAKAVIVFISDDWRRFPWQLTPQMLECLNEAVRCNGTEIFFGLPENPIEASTQ